MNPKAEALQDAFAACERIRILYVSLQSAIDRRDHQAIRQRVADINNMLQVVLGYAVELEEE